MLGTIQPFVIRKNCYFKKKIIEAFNNINNELLEELKVFNIKKFAYVNNDFYFKKYSIQHLLD